MARTMPRAARLLGVLAMAPLLILITTGISFTWPSGGGPPDEALERTMPSIPPKSPREAAVWRAGELNRRAEIYISRQHYRQAEHILKEAIRIYENALGREALEKAGPLRNLATIYEETERDAEATKIRAEVGKITQPYCYRAESNEVIRESRCSAKTIPMLRHDYKKWRESKKTFQAEFVLRRYCYRMGTNVMQLLRGPECAAGAYQMSSSDYLEWRGSKTSFKLQFESIQRTTSAK